jgi:hypothetical protein
MGWLRCGAVKWALVATALLTTSCAGFVGAGAAVVLVGAGVVGFTCYDRVSVTVTDAMTGTKLCDAKVTFIEGTSKTEATSCYQAALTTGKYRMRVERHGLAPYEEPFEVTDSGKCGQSVQTMYVALDRLNRAPAPPLAAVPPVVAAPQIGTVQPPTTTPAPAAAPAAAAPAAAAPAPAPLTAAPRPASAPTPTPAPTAPPRPAPTPAPAATAFPETP